MPLPKSPLKWLPSVDVLLRVPEFSGFVRDFGHETVVTAIREVLDELRQGDLSPDQSVDDIAKQVMQRINTLLDASLKSVFNLTGTILHTNLGRAPLPDVAVQAMVAAGGAVNLEYDLDTGGRGQRDAHLESWIKRLTGAKAAIAVNNNAAAVMIMLNTFALGREVIVSRGELIEIGGAFRLPDIMQRAGCQLREVGTTNRTHLKDFEAAITPETAMILKVHTSNYQVQGFTKSVAEADLSALAKSRNIPFVVDLGSGTLVDLARFGMPHEATVRETLETGADLVSFSGDKLLGGPQAGVIAGRTDLIAKIAENPMKRAMRLDKITIAALAAVLRLYANPDQLPVHLPILAMFNRSVADIKLQAERLKPKVALALEPIARVEIEPSQSQIGSGSIPVDLLAGFALTLSPRDIGDKALRDLAHTLRTLPRPIIGRISNGKIVLDLRALHEEQEFLQQLHLVAC